MALMCLLGLVHCRLCCACACMYVCVTCMCMYVSPYILECTCTCPVLQPPHGGHGNASLDCLVIWLMAALPIWSYGGDRVESGSPVLILQASNDRTSCMHPIPYN